MTLGCSKNLVDSEQLMRQFDALGYEVRHDAEKPDGDIVVVNTCGFIGDAKEESINTILQFEQAKQFTKATDVTALAITKLDGTAKGGVVIGISDQFKIPVKYIGLGEGIDQLQVFDRTEFVASLFE